MSIFDFISDLQTNAAPERGGNWLMMESARNPVLAKAVFDNLNQPPQAVINAIAQQWPMARLYSNHTLALEYISNLQRWLLKHSDFRPKEKTS